MASEAYYREAARLAKARLQIPVMLVGGIRSLEVAEELLAQNEVDYIAMCRPFIRQPDLIKRWAVGQREPSGCQSENACFGLALAGKGGHLCPRLTLGPRLTLRQPGPEVASQGKNDAAITVVDLLRYFLDSLCHFLHS